jgi:NADH:ubiquinone oxidoreductase subunit B-like Fe-S oxidoreductase
LKLAKKAAKRKQIKRGVKEVIKAIRKRVPGCAGFCLACCAVQMPRQGLCAERVLMAGSTASIQTTAGAAAAHSYLS